MKFGSAVSTYGVGMQLVDIWVTDDINKEREILKKILVEGVPMGAVRKVTKRINALPITKNDKLILGSIAEGKGYLLEKTAEGYISDLVDGIFDKMEWTEK